jgi:hypothetical protein
MALRDTPKLKKSIKEIGGALLVELRCIGTSK